MQDRNLNANATLIIGAGELGMAVIRALHESRSPDQRVLSVLLRPQPHDALHSLAAALQGMSVNVVEVDLATASEDDLAAIFSDYSTVICCTGFVGGPGTQRKITAAILKGGVERYVPWQFGVDYDVVGRGSGQEVFDEQADVRDMLRSQSRTQWVIVSTGMFTSFLFEPSFGVVDLVNAKVHALGSWDHRLTVTIPEDIGRLTAAVLAHLPRIDDSVVHVAGDTFSYVQLADMVEHHLNRPVQRVLWDMETLRKEVAAHPQDGMRKYHLAFARDTGVAWNKESTFNVAQQIAVTDVPAWLSQRKEAANTPRLL
jgi:hypothetical protein